MLPHKSLGSFRRSGDVVECVPDGVQQVPDADGQSAIFHDDENLDLAEVW